MEHKTFKRRFVDYITNIGRTTKMARDKVVMVVPEEATGAVEQTQIEEMVDVAQVQAKAKSNVDFIIPELKKDTNFDNVLKNVLDAKPEYKSRENGDKILLKQIKNIYEMIKEKEPRFAKKWKLDSKTGLVVDVDSIDKELAKHSKKKSKE